MKYAIQVHGNPELSRSPHSAFQFIKAALAEGHEIVRVFFYHDGVYNGLGRAWQKERNVPDWEGLVLANGLDLVLCVSAAERRGMLPPASTPAAVAEGFRVGGLGQWMEACLKADRVLVFGG